MLSLYFHELIEKTDDHKQKNCLMVNDYVLDKVLDKTKETKGIVDTKILIDTDDNLPDYITLKNVVILITCVLKMMLSFTQKYF